MRIAEIFCSVQGEGMLTGQPMVFIRLQGCQVGCTWCDSKYTWDPLGGHEMSLQAVKEKVFGYDVDWICITGGEPLEHLDALVQLINAFSGSHSIEVETAGTIRLPEEPLFSQVTSWVVDLKPPSSEVGLIEALEVLSDFSRLRHTDQVKCVVASEDDIDYVSWVFEQSKDTDASTDACILISPAFPLGGVPPKEWMARCAAYVVEHNYRLSLQMHKFIWGDKRGV